MPDAPHRPEEGPAVSDPSEGTTAEATADDTTAEETTAPPGRVQLGAISVACLLLMAAGSAWPFTVGVLAPVLRAELDLSAAALGLAFSAFYLTGSATSRLAGVLVDRRGFRVGGWLLLALSVGQLVLLSGARAWWQLALSGMVGGACMAMSNPVTNSLIAAALRGRAARTVIGFKQSGVPLVAAFAGAVLPTTAAALGWRSGVTVMLAVSAGGAALLLAVSARPAPQVSVLAKAGRRRLGLERFVVFMGMIASGLNGYLALFIVDGFAGSLQRAGTLIATFAVCGVIGRILWATVGGGRRTLPILRTLGSVGFLALAMLAASTAEWGVWVAVAIAGLTVMAWQGLGMLTVVELDPGGTVGAASGRIMRRFYLGFVVGAPLTGLIIDTSGFRAAWMLLGAAALAATLTLRRPDPA
jgi:MFS family permease